MSPRITALMQKSRRALRSARLGLRDGDTDGAVNRSYYAMVSSAQAALLSSGVPEDKLPRTHAGLISAFGERVVKSGKVGAEFGRSMNKTEGLRLRADYTGEQLDLETTEQALADAERFVQSVEQAFGLQSISAEAVPGPHPPAKQMTEDDSLWDKSEGMEERRRQAVQDWLEYRKQQKQAARASAQEREAARAQDKHRTPDSAADITDDPDTA